MGSRYNCPESRTHLSFNESLTLKENETCFRIFVEKKKT